jgi:hypothetical protein
LYRNSDTQRSSRTSTSALEPTDDELELPLVSSGLGPTRRTEHRRARLRDEGATKIGIVPLTGPGIGTGTTER